jgi:hypothetical protein
MGRRVTAPPPLLSPSNILPPTSSHCPYIFPQEKFGAGFENIISIYVVFIPRNFEIA